MAPTTPPPNTSRPRTPPTPYHGPMHDSYEPYSPPTRRSARNTAIRGQHTPLKETGARHTTPPPSSRRARFSGTQLSSPPSSPASPVTRSHTALKKTPARRAANGAQSDSDSSHHPLSHSSALPTPQETPMKRSAVTMNATTSGKLNFQAQSPNDVMPTPRKIKKPRSTSMRGFDLYEDVAETSQDAFPIFTDANARVPELDMGEDNPFVGPRAGASSRTPRRSNRSKTEEEREMQEAVAREEGLIYVFRGKKVLRRFETDTPPGSANSDLAQRSIKRQAGTTAHRPLTRSSIKPRLLFPSEEQIREREGGGIDIDEEEALTDIEIPAQHKTTPQKPLPAAASYLATPPSTNRTKRTINALSAPQLETLEEEEGESAPASPVAGKKRKTTSPFDDWPRSKAGVSGSKAGKKREASGISDVGGREKRTRSGAVASPA